MHKDKRLPTRLLLAGLIAAVSAFALFLSLRLSGPATAGLHQLEGRTMGTAYRVQLPRLPADMDREQLAATIQSRLDRLDRDIFSTYSPQSELSRFNRHPVGAPFSASRELVEVVLLAQEVHDLAGGAFDMSVGPLTDLWGFGPGGAPDKPPTPAQVNAARQRLGSGDVEAVVQTGTLRKTRDLRLDLSGIAKGYAVDRLADFLDRRGLEDYLVEIGGELRIKGGRAPGQPWRLAIETPDPGIREAFLGFSSKGDSIAVAGSGDYRNYLEFDGKRYSHELDPRTGYPVRHTLAGVTVINASAGRADALATALMVLGPDDGFSLASDQELAAFFIMRDEDGRFIARHTAAFARYLD